MGIRLAAIREAAFPGQFATSVDVDRARTTLTADDDAAGRPHPEMVIDR
jgi:hypothetical protein